MAKEATIEEGIADVLQKSNSAAIKGTFKFVAQDLRKILNNHSGKMQLRIMIKEYIEKLNDLT